MIRLKAPCTRELYIRGAAACVHAQSSLLKNSVQRHKSNAAQPYQSLSAKRDVNFSYTQNRRLMPGSKGDLFSRWVSWRAEPLAGKCANWVANVLEQIRKVSPPSQVSACSSTQAHNTSAAEREREIDVHAVQWVRREKWINIYYCWELKFRASLPLPITLAAFSIRSLWLNARDCVCAPICIY